MAGCSSLWKPGETAEVTWENTPITGQIQVHKYADGYNEVTGTPAGAPLQGAVYEISEARSGKVVDYITTDARGVAASKPLPLGRYKIVEVIAPAYWQVSGTAANGYQIINRADVGGKYQGTWQTAQATWVTLIRKLTNTVVPTLPKTGY